MAGGRPSQPPPSTKDGVFLNKSQLSSNSPSFTFGDFPVSSFSKVTPGHCQRSSSSTLKLNGLGPQQRDPEATSFKQISEFKGKPAIYFSATETLPLLENLRYVLIGKFSHGRPPMVTIRTFFARLSLQGNFNISSADSKHIYIECSCSKDFYFIWLEFVWFIEGFAMRIFKWDVNFSPSAESPLAPVWIRLVGLPLYLFDKMPLLNIANAIGKPICIDSRNLNRSILNVARICVEMDVSKPIVDAIWIGIKNAISDEQEKGFWVQVKYDFVPYFCSKCCHIGHLVDKCKRKEAEINAVDDVTEVTDEAGNSEALCKQEHGADTSNRSSYKDSFSPSDMQKNQLSCPTNTLSNETEVRGYDGASQKHIWKIVERKKSGIQTGIGADQVKDTAGINSFSALELLGCGGNDPDSVQIDEKDEPQSGMCINLQQSTVNTHEVMCKAIEADGIQGILANTHLQQANCKELHTVHSRFSPLNVLPSQQVQSRDKAESSHALHSRFSPLKVLPSQQVQSRDKAESKLPSLLSAETVKERIAIQQVSSDGTDAQIHSTSLGNEQPAQNLAKHKPGLMNSSPVNSGAVSSVLPTLCLQAPVVSPFRSGPCLNQPVAKATLLNGTSDANQVVHRMQQNQKIRNLECAPSSRIDKVQSAAAPGMPEFANMSTSQIRLFTQQQSREMEAEIQSLYSETGPLHNLTSTKAKVEMLDRYLSYHCTSEGHYSGLSDADASSQYEEIDASELSQYDEEILDNKVDFRHLHFLDGLDKKKVKKASPRTPRFYLSKPWFSVRSCR